MVQVGDRVQLTVPNGFVSPLSWAGDEGLSAVMMGFYRVGSCEETVLRLRLDHPFAYCGREYSYVAMVGRESGETWDADSGRCRVYLVNHRSHLSVSREGMSDEFVTFDGNVEYRIVRDRFTP